MTRRYQSSPVRRLVFVRYSSSTSIKESLLARTFPREWEKMSSHPQLRLHTFLSDFLPPPPSHYRPTVFMYPGSHLVYFPPAVPEHQLLQDGTDLLHAPDTSYKYRLWAGGDVQYVPDSQALNDHGSMALDQRIIDVQPRPSDQEGKVWVQIRREISSVLRMNNNKPILKQLLTENRWLVFSQGKPSVTLDRSTPPPLQPYYSTSLRTTSALLFRFSALTLNAHAIHIDPQYAKEEYGLPGLLVHGPLTFVLIMEVLARCLDQYARATGLDSPRLQVKKAVYRNLMPILVGEEISVCCKPVNDVQGKESQMQVGEEGRWEAWVQKLVDGQPSLCVKAAVTVAYLPVSKRVTTDDRRHKDGSAPRVRRILQSDNRAKPEAERRPRTG